MMPRWGLVAAALISVALSGQAQAEWLEARSRHFTVVGDISEQSLRRQVDRLERFDATMRLILPRSTEFNLPVMVVPTDAVVRELARSPDSGLLAYFLPSPYGVFAVTPATITGRFRDRISESNLLFHEYAHHILLGSVDDPMPRWMNEGMAELFMNTRLDDDGSVTIGLGDETRAYSLVRLGRWTAERLFESDLKPPDKMDIDQIYAKGWLVLHYLMLSGERAGEFAKFTDGMKRGLPQPEAARQAFGDLRKFDSDLEYYRARKQLPAVHIARDRLAASSEIRIRRLTPGEGDIMPLRWRSMAGVTPEDAAEIAAKGRPIAARYPDSAFVQRAMAEMEFDAHNYAAADLAIDRALAADPEFVDAMAFKGLLLGAGAKRDGNSELWQQARTWILKANHAQPDNAFPLILYYDSFGAAGEAPPTGAVNALMRAIVLQPSYQELRAKVAVQLIAAGDLKAARGVLAPLALAPHRAPDNPYARLLAELDKGTSGAALTAMLAELKIGAQNLFVQQAPPQSSPPARSRDVNP
jgi:tetratricopeptide (TPR) repeat protein